MHFDTGLRKGLKWKPHSLACMYGLGRKLACGFMVQMKQQSVLYQVKMHIIQSNQQNLFYPVLQINLLTGIIRIGIISSGETMFALFFFE